MTLSKFQYFRRLWVGAAVLLAFLALTQVKSAWIGETHETIEVVGIFLILAGIVGRLWCILYIGGKKSSELVRQGPYSISRNPLYVFSAIAAGGVGLQSGSVVVGLIFALGCAVLFQLVIHREEKHLGGMFGEPYAAYLREVPRFWPKFSIYRDSTTLDVVPRRVYVTLMDGLVFFAAKPAFEAVEYLQSSGVIDASTAMF